MITLTLLVLRIRGNPRDKKNKELVSLLLLYVVLSALSLFILPLGYIAKTYSLLGVQVFFHSLINADAGSYLYPIAAVNRLILFFLFIMQISGLSNSREAYKTLFTGVLFGAVLSVFLGLSDYYSIISLERFRSLDPNVNPFDIQIRLQSTFGHPGWFGEFITISIPFLLAGFYWKKDSSLWKFLLFVILFLSEIVLILSKARAVWVALPPTIFFFWLLLLNSNNLMTGLQLNRKTFLKTIAFLSITVIAGFITVYSAMGINALPLQNMTEDRASGNWGTNKKNIEKRLSEAQSIESPVIRKFPNPFKSNDLVRQHNLIMKRENLMESLGTRVSTIWMQGIDLGAESPFFGVGYESYRWHTNILFRIPEYLAGKNNTISLDTPHSFFVQLFVSGGIAGLLLWILIVVYAFMLLLKDFKHNKTHFNIPVMLSIISFHIYGIFQSMQYIPMVWLLIFLNIGYALTISGGSAYDRNSVFLKMIIKIFILIVIVSGLVYFKYPASEKIGKKYGLKIYAIDQDRDKYIGFYQPEQWPTGNFRWSRSEGIIGLPINKTIELSFHAGHPDIEQNPVTLDLFLNKKPFDQITFHKKEAVTRKYYIPPASSDIQQLFFNVSRTWNPYKYGISKDNRDLGVAVSEIKYIDKFPENGIGFHNWETWGGEQIPGWPDNQPIKFRWTGMRASINLKNRLDKEFALFLLASHPDINEDPVKVALTGDGGFSRKVIFTDGEWKKVILQKNELKDSNVLTLQVDRTWNPELTGMSDDSRDLGVVVAVPEE